jgi:hypothetical protein
MNHWLIDAGSTAAAITAIGWLVVRGFRALRRFFHLLEVLDSRTRQLENNGGGSLKDTVEAIQADLVDVKSEVAAIKRNQQQSDRGRNRNA